MTTESQWTGRESNTAEYLRLSREKHALGLCDCNDLAARAQALIADNRRLLDELRNPTGDGHRYGHASEDEITAQRMTDAPDEPDGMEESC